MDIFERLRTKAQNLVQGVSDYFAPSSQGVRVRDVVREIPGATANVLGGIGRNIYDEAKYTVQHPQEIPQIINRNLIQPPKNFAENIGTSLANPYVNKVFEESQRQTQDQAKLYLDRALKLSQVGDPKASSYFDASKQLLDQSRNTAQVFTDTATQNRGDMIQSGMQTANVAGALYNPAAATQTSVLGGLLNSVLAKSMGNTDPGSFYQGMDDASQYAGLTNVSNPIISGVVGKAGNVLNNPMARNLTSRALNAVGNVAEDRAIDAGYGTERDITQDLTSAGLGFLLGGKGDVKDYEYLKKQLTTGGLDPEQSKALKEILQKMNAKIDATAESQGLTRPEFLQRGGGSVGEGFESVKDILAKKVDGDKGFFEGDDKVDSLKSKLGKLYDQFKPEIDDMRSRNVPDKEIEDAVWAKVTLDAQKEFDPEYKQYDEFLNNKNKPEAARTNTEKPAFLSKPEPTQDAGYMDSLLQNTQAKPKYDVMQRIRDGQPLTDNPKLQSSEVKPEPRVMDAQPEVNLNVKPEIKTDISHRDSVLKAKSKEETKAIRDGLDERIAGISRFIKDTGKTLKDIAKELQDKTIIEKSPEAQAVKEWFDTFKARAEADGVRVGTLEDYFVHMTEETADSIINNPPKPDTFGDSFIKPLFARKRTDKLQDYSFDEKVLKAYALEMMRNSDLSEAQKADLRLAKQITDDQLDEIKLDGKEDNRSYLKKLGSAFVKDFKQSVTKGNAFTKVYDAVSKIQTNAREMEKIKAREPEAMVVYDGKVKSSLKDGTSNLLRSTADRAERAGQRFYDDFFWPFRSVEMKTTTRLKELTKASDEIVTDEYMRIYRKKPAKDLERNDMIQRLVLTHWSELQREALNIFKDNAAKADFKQTWMKDLANQIFDEYVGDSIRNKGVSEKVMGQIRAMTGRGALGLNLASAINNVFELRRAYAVINTNNMVDGIKELKNGRHFASEYGIKSDFGTVAERGSLIDQRNKTKQVIEKVDKGLFYMFDKTEQFKDELMLAGFEAQGKSKGLKDEALRKYVLQKFDKYAIKYGKGQDIGLFRSPLMKTLFQFAQYPIKDAVIMADKIAGIPKDAGDRAYAIKYAYTTVAQAILFKTLIGKIGFGGQTGTPYDLWTEIANGFGEKGNRQIPFVSPAVQAMFSFSQDIADTVTGTERDDYQKYQRDKTRNRALSTVLVPASNQLYFKTGKNLQDQSKGYQEKYKGDKPEGNIANPMSTDAWSRTKGALFGSAYDPQRQTYYDDIKKYGNGNAGLDKTQSDAFRALPKEERQAYYDETVAANRKQVDDKKILDNIVSGKEPKTNFMDKLLNRKSKAIEDVLTTPQTAEERKQHKKVVETLLDSGRTVPEKDIQTAIFNDKKANSKNIQENMDVYKALNTYMSSEDYTDEQKKTILKASGASDSEYAYYQSAAKDVDVKLQNMVPALEQMNHQDAIKSLIQGRAFVGGKQLVTSDMLTYLYERDYISKDEKEMLSAIKFDQLTGDFYVSKSYKGSGGGKISYAKALKLFEKVDIPEVKSLKGLASINSLMTPSSTRKSAEKLLSDVLSKKPQTPKSSGKRLWFDS